MIYLVTLQNNRNQTRIFRVRAGNVAIARVKAFQMLAAARCNLDLWIATNATQTES